MKRKDIFREYKKGEFRFPIFEIPPIEGYKPKCENFPNCCDFHKSVYEGAKRWLNKFPYCCDYHKECAKQFWFDRREYEGFAEKIVKQVSYTEYLVSKAIERVDWYEQITNYIAFNVSSFGDPPAGHDKYLKALGYYFDNNKTLSDEKKQRLLEFIEFRLSPPKAEIPEIDLNDLHHVIQKWLDVLPELEHCKELKERLKGKFPADLVFYDVQKNPYLGRASAKARTEREVIELLVNFTKELLLKIDTANMVKQGLIDKAAQVGLNADIEAHRITQVALLGEFSKGEKKYLKIMKKWLANETAFFKRKVEPLLKKNPQPASSKKDAVKPASQDFGAELVEVVKSALKTKELLTPTGKFAGKGRVHWKVRALYDALNDRRRNYIPDIPYKEDAFSDFFKTHFGFYISGTSLRTSPTKEENIEREDELKLEFLAIIPKK